MERMMLDGLAIVIERMETNPEEFMPHDGRWEFLIDHHAYDIFTEEERVALEEAKIKLEGAKREMRRQAYTTQVLDLLSADKEDQWTAIKRRQGREHIKNILSAGVENIAKDHQYKWAEVLKGEV
jgi:hypothetical protein